MRIDSCTLKCFGPFLTCLTVGVLLTSPSKVWASTDVQCQVADGRREFLLEYADAAAVVKALAEHYPDMVFQLHPTQNGFYAFGSREQVMLMLAEMRELDRKAKPTPDTKGI